MAGSMTGSPANISACLITRDEATSGLLEGCLASVRPHVAEIVVVDTGSSDDTIAVVRRYADIVESFDACNDPQTGAMADFSRARNRSFDLATKPWVMWLDADDVLTGGEHLARLVAMGDANRGGRDWCYLFPYEYVYDPHGKCICLHYRERLVSRRAAMRWVNPVHEVMIPSDDAKLALVPCDDVVVKHQRQRSKKVQEGGRNLRILQKLVETDGSDDARQWYYLGLEYANAGKIDKAEHWLGKYVSVSGWDDEKTMACLKLAELCYAQNKIRDGLVWAFRAIETRESWGEGYIALARGFFSLALMGPTGGDVRRNWEKCAHFARLALTMPPTRTMLFVNPQERALDVHVFLTMALSQMGDARGALTHAEEAFKVTPDDPNLVYNKRVFERLVATDDAEAALNRLVAAQSLSASTRDAIVSAINTGCGAVGAWPSYDRPDGYPRNVEQKHFPVAVVTPHARAFGIPESTELDDLPVVMTDAQVEAATLLLWKEYILHDEVMAAERLLADAPYRVKHSVAVQRALERTRAMTAWMTDASSEQTVNTPEDPTIENGVPLPGPLTGALAARADMARSGLRRGERVLDLGCFDGGIVNRWALDGLDVTGVDLCAGSIALAQQKAGEFSTGAKFICSKFADLTAQGAYDVVTCCDTYEHVRDQVKDLIAPARRALTATGRMVVVTPHGAWMRGQYVPWAHPWRWADDEARPWNTDLPHAHLVAPTPWTVAEQFRRDGWTVRDSYVVLSDDVRDVAGQGNVYTESHVAAPTVAEGGSLDIVFACGDAWEQWTPLVHRDKGIGGSETMVVEMAKRLARAGHRVRVYTSTGKDGEGIYDGVEYRQTAMLELARECDVLIAWRNAAMLETDIRAKVRLLWVHDIYAGNASHRALLMADRVLALSRWHKGVLATHHNLAPEQVRVTRNGIDLSRFDGPVERNAHKAVYSSSPDRGLPVLLDVWPKIRELVPDAELHVFYGFDNWRKMAAARNDDAQVRAVDSLETRVRALESAGVVYRGKVDQATLAREFCSAGVWCSPTWFTETSCISAMEAQAAGLRVVTSAIAALNETVGDRHGVLLEGDWLSADYQGRFVDEVVRAMVAPEVEWVTTRFDLTQRARRDFGLDALASDWVAMMRDEIEQMTVSPLVPYQCRADFVRDAAE